MKYQVLKTAYDVISLLVPSVYYPYKIDGSRIYLDITESPMMLARVTGRYETAKHQALQRFLNPGDTFVDVGANKGDFSLLAARLVGEQGRVVSFEPEPGNCGWFRKSIQRNGYNNVSPLEMALSDSDGQAQLYLGKKSGWNTLLPGQASRENGVIEVELRTLDGLVSDGAVDRKVDAIKIDVEGAEMSVLRGAAGVLEANADIKVLMDIHPDMGVDPAEVCSFLGDRGFRVFHEEDPFDREVTDYERLTSVFARRT